MDSRIGFLNLMLTTTLCVFASQFPAYGALDLTSISYMQDFDFLSSSTSPVTWVDDQGFEDTMGSPGWYWVSPSLTYSVSFGDEPGAGMYSYGLDMGSDRAMGSITTSSVTVWGLVLRNTLSDAIVDLQITYTGEKWRDGNAASDGIAFSYKTSSADITDMEAAEALPSGWTAVPALNFTTTDGVDVGPVNGNDPVNRATLSQTISVTVPVGQYIAMRWFDSNVTGADHGIAIDDLTVVAVPEASAIFSSSIICAVVAIAAIFRRHKSSSRC